MLTLVFAADLAADPAVDPTFDNAPQAFGSENIRGLVKARRTAILSSEIPAKITAMPFREGDRFAQGDSLVKFDCSLHRANLSAASAELEARSKKHANNKRLAELEAISDIEVQMSAALASKASSQRDAAAIRVERCQIKAPYAGRVVTVWAHAFESVETDKDLLSILDDRELDIELIIPSRWLGWLREGEPFTFQVDETGDQHQATIYRIGAAVDAASQTIRVTGRFAGSAGKVLSGMSGTAVFANSSANSRANTGQP